MTKAELRAQILAARAGMTPSQLVAAADAVFGRLAEFLTRHRPETITAYVPVGSEPGGPDLPERLAAAFPGTTLLLPVLLPDLDLDWAVYNGPSSLRRASRGLREPMGPGRGVGAIAGAQVAVVPALAVDRSGYRLGRGGGSYDRALARFRGVSVALLHPGELVSDLPHESHDVRVGFALGG